MWEFWSRGPLSLIISCLHFMISITRYIACSMISFIIEWLTIHCRWNVLLITCMYHIISVGWNVLWSHLYHMIYVEWNVLWSHDCITCFLFDKMFYDSGWMKCCITWFVEWNVLWSHDFFWMECLMITFVSHDFCWVECFLKSQVCNKLFVINENVMITTSLINEVLSSQMIITGGMNK
jgi:hypothetical protein